MSIRVKCSSCQQTIKAEDRYAGRTVRCPACREPITIPNPAAVASPAPEDSLDPFAAAAAPAPPPPPPTDTTASKPRRPKTAAKPAEPAAREVPEDEIGDWLSEGPPLRSESFEPDAEPVPQSPNWTGVTETYDLAETPREEADETGNLPPLIRKKKKKKRPRDSDEIRVRSPYDAPPVGRPWLLWALAFCMLPLAVSVFLPEKSITERIELAAAEDPALADRLETLPELSDDPVGTLLSAFPDNRIPGAAFRRDTFWHYGLAAISGIAFLGLILAAWPDEEVSPGYLIGMGLLTGTIGIFLLLSFQAVADFTQGFYLRGRSFIVALFYLVKFIGFSYRCAIDPSIGFGLSFMGYTFGVGFCEELCKAVPIVLYLWGNHKHTWQGATVVGFASGIGFGVSEGITYSAEMYNGVATGGIYAVRFLSCVALHTVWAGSVGLLMFRDQSHLSEIEWDDILMFVVKYLGVAMVLHGLYDVLLKFDHEIGALVIAAVSFLWLLYLVSRQQREDLAIV